MTDPGTDDPKRCETFRMQTVEHIVLESGVWEVPQLSSARIHHARVRIGNRARRRALELDIIDYYFLAVRSWRAGIMLTEYVLDLRFVDPRPELSRHIAWRWIVAALVLTASALEPIVRLGPVAQRWWRYDWPLPSIALMTAGILAAVAAVMTTTETVKAYSLHGRAAVLEFAGGLGTRRALRTFIAKLAAHVQLAAAARRAALPGHLSDEMREHARLKVLGVLSQREYEAAKARILGQHSDARNPSSRSRRPGNPRPSATGRSFATGVVGRANPK